MQISLELKDGKNKLARFQCEVHNGKAEFSKLVNSLTFAALAKPVELTIPKGAKVTQKLVEELKKPVQITVETEVKPHKWEPEVISEEVVVHEEEKPNKHKKEIMLVAKCECGNTKIFKTKDNAGNVFECDCGKKYPIENSIKMIATCPNCGHSSHGFRTLKDMDVSDFLRCKKCESPIDLKYNKKEKEWQGLE